MDIIYLNDTDEDYEFVANNTIPLADMDDCPKQEEIRLILPVSFVIPTSPNNYKEMTKSKSKRKKKKKVKEPIPIRTQDSSCKFDDLIKDINYLI